MDIIALNKIIDNMELRAVDIVLTPPDKREDSYDAATLFMVVYDLRKCLAEDLSPAP